MTSTSTAHADALAHALVALTPDNPNALARLGPLYADDVTFTDPLQVIHGKKAFMAMNEKLLRRLRRLSWEIVSRGQDSENANGENVFLEWVMRGAPKLGPKIEVAGTTRARYRGGLIVDHRDYWDFGELVASSLPGGVKALHFRRAPLA